MAAPLNVEVVAADRMVWEGEAEMVIVRTTEGDIGIQSGHEPLLAGLVPCAAEIVASDGRREMVAIDGGFLSVAANRVSLVSQYATMSQEVSVDAAQTEFDTLSKLHQDGDATQDEVHRMHLAAAQLKAARKGNSHPF